MRSRYLPPIVSLLLSALIVAFVLAQADPGEETVAAHRLNYPARLSPAASEALLREIAADLNAGLAPDVYGVLKDAGGNHCGAIECDIICRADGQHWDVLTDSTDTTSTSEGDHNHNGISDDLEDGLDDGMYFGTSAPAWQSKGLVVPSRCEIVPGANAPSPPPADCPPAPPCPTCPPPVACPPPPICPVCPPDQSAEVEQLQAQVAAQQKLLESRRCVARLFGVIPVACRIIP